MTTGNRVAVAFAIAILTLGLVTIMVKIVPGELVVTTMVAMAMGFAGGVSIFVWWLFSSEDGF